MAFKASAFREPVLTPTKSPSPERFRVICAVVQGPARHNLNTVLS